MDDAESHVLIDRMARTHVNPHGSRPSPKKNGPPALGLSGANGSPWEGFVGQEAMRRQLQVAAASARKRGQPMNHVLLTSGEPGVGKTTLAYLIAHELGAGVKEVSGRVGPNDARLALAEMADLDVLLVDELHRIGKQGFDWLMHMLEDGVIVGPTGPEAQPKVTIVATTTDMGALPNPLISRFPMQPRFEDYTPEQATEIALRWAAAVITDDMPLPDTDLCEAVGRAANANPRTIRSIMENLRDIYAYTDAYDFDEAIGWLGLSADGLTSEARAYLRVLYTEFHGQAGEKAMADRLNEPGGVRHIETLLIKKGYISRQSKGRVLTQPGIHRAMKEAT